MPDAVIRPMADSDLPTARKIFCAAFGTFLGAPDPETFWTDRDYVYGRHGAEHVKSFCAELDGELVGLNMVTRWGSVGFFGPLAVRPDLWNRGIAQPLVQAVSDAFDEWGVSHAGLCTFPHSPKHIHLYTKFGFHPRFLTALMMAPAKAAEATDRWSRYSALAPGDRAAAEAACREVADALHPGLDLSGEIRTVAERNLGDTLLLQDGAGVLPALRSAIGVRRARPARAAVLSNSARSSRVRGPPRTLPRYSTAAARLPRRSACRTCWRASISPAKKPIATWWSGASAPRSSS
jgi:N-acetylglutamate synthase-like GNAT family acetyltransferase